MSKRDAAILLCVFLAACDTIPRPAIETAIKMCEANGGIEKMRVDASMQAAYCRNGAIFKIDNKGGIL